MSTPDTTLAIALVVDASFTLLSHWKHILQLYVSPLVRRVAETHPNCPYTLGFVTYGSSETSPSPILCKKFFQESSLVISAMREDPPKHFGLGSTTTGGSKGLATLEGLVAGIEMFDTLLKTRDFKSHRPPVFHLIHLSASVADDSLHPQWNDLSELDETTWEKLPSELSNRDINFSSIVLNLKNTKCSELHSSVPAPKKVNPWFPVDNNHSVLLSGFNVSPPSKGTKRAGDSSTADKPPEKKPRQTLAVSPVLANSSPAAKPSTTNIPPESQAFWPTTNFPVSSLPPAYQAVLAEFRKEEERIRRMQAAVQAAMSAGQHEKVPPIKEEMQKAFTNVQKTRAAVMTLAARINQGNGSQPFRPTPGQRAPEANVVATANQAASSQNSPPVALKPGNTANADTTQRPLPTHTPTPSVDNNIAVLDPRNPSQSELGQNTASNSSAPNHAGTTQQSKMQMLAPDVAAQMQKLIEQSERSGRLQQPFIGANTAATQTQNTNQAFSQSQLTNVTPDAAGPILGGNVNANPMTGGSKPLVAPAGTKGPPAWQGVFFLPADPQTGRRELKVQVAMFSNAQSLSAARPDTWPPLMQLANTRDPLVHAIDFQIWCKQRQPLVCTVHPAAGGNEANSANFRLLFETLQNSQCYAVARWAISNGAPSINALFFAHNNTTLAAVICPITGIPELPKHGLALKLPLSETQRQVVLTAYARAASTNPSFLNANRPGMMPGQQHLGGIAGAVRPGVGSAQLGQQSQPTQPINPVAMNALMGQLGNFTGSGPVMPNMGSSVNFPNMMMNNLGRQPPGAGMGGNVMPSISPEMMQSFMQRNAEGNGGQGPGMG